jgi:hypothetical protein
MTWVVGVTMETPNVWPTVHNLNEYWTITTGSLRHWFQKGTEGVKIPDDLPSRLVTQVGGLAA